MQMVYATVLGGEAMTFNEGQFDELELPFTIGGLKELMDLDEGTYGAVLNGEDAEDYEELSGGAFVTFAPKVKGGV